MSAPDRDTIARRFKAVCLRALPLMIGGGLVAAAFLPGSTALGRDESGMFDVLLGRRPAPAFRPAPAMFEDFAPVERKRRPRPTRTFLRAPPDPAALGASVPSPGWMAAIMADETLRPRDIVMFPDGPKVFVGIGFAPPWSASDFEDVATSRAVGKRSREAIAAVVGTRGGVEFAALPARDKRLRVTVSDRALAGTND